ncbi:hypothetical protein BDL97_01G123600, partial [Sphagnum fallax]
ENKLLSVSIPLTLKASVSPIKSKITAAVRSTMIFPATSATFYKAAGIMCNEDIEIQSYETKANATSGHDHASQVFTTINNFQLDFFLEENLSKGPTCQHSLLVSILARTREWQPSWQLQLNLWEIPAMPREHRACPTSMEEMVAFVATKLGNKVEVLSTSQTHTSAPIRKGPVKILSFQKRSLVEGKNILYYCHHVTRTKVVRASLIGTDSSVIHGVAICHINTALWASKHPAFAALDIPHGAEACHHNTHHNLIWMKQTNEVPRNKSSKSEGKPKRQMRKKERSRAG